MFKIVRRLHQRMRSASSEPLTIPSPPTINLLNACRFLYQKRLMDIIRNLDGDIVECGVGVGQTLLYWAILAYDEGHNRRIWGFDSFEGFPEPGAEDASPRNPKKGEWAVGSIRSIQDLLLQSGLAAEWVRSHVTLIKGFFEESLPKYTGSKIVLLHIDADLYRSYKAALEILYPKVVRQGVVAFDEYMGTWEHYYFPGAKKAIDEFFSGLDVEILRDPAFGKYYIVKPI